MAILLGTPAAGDVDEVVRTLARWRREGAPMQLHPGDVGFYLQVGSERVAAALRIWSRRGRILGVGMLDGPELLRTAIAPELREDEALARRMAEDVTLPERGVLPGGKAQVEALWQGRFREVLLADGWEPDESWIPMARDLSAAVEDGGLRIEAVGPERVEDRIAVHREAFPGSRFDAERWQNMASGAAYTAARCLVGYDRRGAAVAATTVWSAGPGRPGLIEPLGVHRGHRGRGHGQAIALAAAAALRGMGASSATVCAESANAAAVATYLAAGFVPQPEVPDLTRIG